MALSESELFFLAMHIHGAEEHGGDAIEKLLKPALADAWSEGYAAAQESWSSAREWGGDNPYVSEPPDMRRDPSDD